MTWTFNLRPGISFHDGTALNADAVAFNIRRWWDRDNPDHNGNFPYFSRFFGGFRGDPGCQITGVSAVGTMQVQIILAAPNSALPACWRSPPSVSPARRRSRRGRWQPIRWVPGPSTSRSGYPATTSAWPQTPRTGAARRTWRAWSSESSLTPLPGLPRRSQAPSRAPKGTRPGAATDPDLHPMSRPSVNIGYLGINRGHDPLGNPLVQQAMHPSTVLHSSLRTTAVARWSHISFCRKSSGGMIPDRPTNSYYPGLAKSLLGQAGFPDGFTTTLAYANASVLIRLIREARHLPSRPTLRLGHSCPARL